MLDGISIDFLVRLRSASSCGRQLRLARQTCVFAEVLQHVLSLVALAWGLRRGAARAVDADAGVDLCADMEKDHGEGFIPKVAIWWSAACHSRTC
jgi:hypothetical protein